MRGGNESEQLGRPERDSPLSCMALWYGRSQEMLSDYVLRDHIVAVFEILL